MRLLIVVAAACVASCVASSHHHHHHHAAGDCAEREFNDTVLGYSRRLNKPRRRRALVTGAAGFIGSHVAEFCAARLDFFTVGVDDLSGGFLENFDPAASAGGKFMRGDVQDDVFVRLVS